MDTWKGFFHVNWIQVKGDPPMEDCSLNDTGKIHTTLQATCENVRDRFLTIWILILKVIYYKANKIGRDSPTFYQR